MMVRPRLTSAKHCFLEAATVLFTGCKTAHELIMAQRDVSNAEKRGDSKVVHSSVTDYLKSSKSALHCHVPFATHACPLCPLKLWPFNGQTSVRPKFLQTKQWKVSPIREVTSHLRKALLHDCVAEARQPQAHLALMHHARQMVAF